MATDEFGLEGQRLEGRYEVEQKVAVGGFGVVYKGYHRALRTPVAIKVLKIPGDLSDAAKADFAKSFLAEAQTLAALQHPAVVKALDFGVTAMPVGQTAPWMVLEWVDGPTLREHLRAHRGELCPPDRCLALLRPVIEAIASAHEAGIVHRDLKPANIMLPRVVGDGPAARVLDFGIAKAMGPDEGAAPSGQTQTASTMSAFSLKYAAPEQLGGLRTGPWTDVHALALILTEMIVGQEVYPGTDRMEISAAVLGPQRPTPAAFGVSVGPWEPVLARAMSFKPMERFRNVREFLTALEAEVPKESRKVGESLIEAPATPSAFSLVTAATNSTFRPSEVHARAASSKRRLPVAVAAVTLALLAVAGTRWAIVRSGSHARPSAVREPLTAPPALVAPLTVVDPPAPDAPRAATAPTLAAQAPSLDDQRDAGRRGRSRRHRAPSAQAAATQQSPPVQTELPRTAPPE